MSERMLGLGMIADRLRSPNVTPTQAARTIERLRGMPLQELVELTRNVPLTEVTPAFRSIIEQRLNPDFVERQGPPPTAPGYAGAPRALTNAPVGAGLATQFAQAGQNLQRLDRANPANTVLPIPEGPPAQLPPMAGGMWAGQPVPEGEAANLGPMAPTQLPPPPPARPRPPVATPGNAMPGGPATPQPGTGAPPEAAQQAQVAQAAQQAAAQGNTSLADRLMAFGFAMAASRNPSLFGMIGEGGQAMMQGQRQERQDALRQREVEGGLSIQQARLNLMEAELRWQQQPDNPRNIRDLAAARADMARAATAGQSAREDPIAGYQTDNDGNVFGVTRSGQSRPITDPQGRPVRPQRDETQDATARRTLYSQTYLQAYRSLTEADPMNPLAQRMSPGQAAQEAARIAEQAVRGAMGTVGVQRGQGGTQVQTPPPVNTGPNTRINPQTGRLEPIQR
jgi:hypothetical protein